MTLHGYPRPQLQRSGWTSLNGAWDFAITGTGTRNQPTDWRLIQVPFAPETPASGVAQTDLFSVCWYRRFVSLDTPTDGSRTLIHFGAVDYSAEVWLNGVPAGYHEGGFTPFTIDATGFLVSGEPLEILVRAEDDPLDLAKPRGKQDWQRDPHSIWYPRTTGIWQTVWAENVPATFIGHVRWTPNLERWELGLTVGLEGDLADGLSLEVELSLRGVVMAHDTYRVLGREIHRRFALSDPGIDDYRNTLLWNPSSPTLITATLRLSVGPHAAAVDTVQSYTALRSVAFEGDHFVLNGRPYPLRLVLDQGYWPNTGMTPPGDDDVRRDVELAKAMGFNGVRKHQKIEDPRYLYWADRLGLLVWEEMPSAYRFTPVSVERVAREWMAAIARDYSHPCIVTWVPFNESWGVPNLPAIAAERHWVHALFNLTKTLDPTRPVVGNDGWESVATDVIGIHDYDEDIGRLAARYRTRDTHPRCLERERPAGRLLVLDKERHAGLPVVLSECGGITFADDPLRTWGYSRAASADDLERRYRSLMTALHSLPFFAGFCYTQFADTYQEANGLLYADRRPKFPLQHVASATTGRMRQPDLETVSEKPVRREDPQ